MAVWKAWPVAAALAASACAPRATTPQDRDTAGRPRAGSIIRITGSDTMSSLLQAWAEEYASARPDVSVRVAGGGSGVGLAALAQGLTDLAASSREMTPEERRRMPSGRSIEFVVALDAIAVYVHRTNPLESIALADLAEIYGDGGAVDRWSQLGVRMPRCRSDVVVRIGRQNSSGTYTYFRAAVLGHGREYRLGSIDQSGPKDVVVLTSRTPCAIGYSGLAYAAPDVKVLRISRIRGQPGVAPSVATASDGSYALARRLYLYAATEPVDDTRQFLEWAVGAAGQGIVLDVGLVPIRESDT